MSFHNLFPFFSSPKSFRCSLFPIALLWCSTCVLFILKPENSRDFLPLLVLELNKRELWSFGQGVLRKKVTLKDCKD